MPFFLWFLFLFSSALLYAQILFSAYPFALPFVPMWILLLSVIFPPLLLVLLPYVLAMHWWSVDVVDGRV